MSAPEAGARRPSRQRSAVLALLEELDGFRTAQELHVLLAGRGERVGLACTIGLVVSVSGTTASYYTSTPSGGTIVLLAIASFLLVRAVVALRDAGMRRRHRRRAAIHAAHPHEHGPECGHRPVPHGDHVDYDHDGHLHAPHPTGSGVHYDEHGAPDGRTSAGRSAT